MKKTIDIITTAVFVLLLAGFMAAFMLLPAGEVSTSERRKLKQQPELKLEDVMDAGYMKELEEYFLDQFPLRDGFRTVKSVLSYNIFRKMDNNGVFIIDDSVYKLEFPLKEQEVNKAADKLLSVKEKYLEGSRVFWSMIPDKNFYIQGGDYPTIDYDRMLEILKGKLGSEGYIDITGELNIDSYYRTDAHWEQQDILPVADKLASAMGVELPKAEYIQNTLSPFYGVYCGQSALPGYYDDLTYLTNEITDGLIMWNAETNATTGVYTVDRFETMDGYNLYMYGAAPLLTLENPANPEGRELIIFRDSFSSSLVPLMAGGYSKITLVDLRYMASQLLPQFVDFHGQDVLFLYSSTLYNSGSLLK